MSKHYVASVNVEHDHGIKQVFVRCACGAFFRDESMDGVMSRHRTHARASYGACCMKVGHESQSMEGRVFTEMQTARERYDDMLEDLMRRGVGIPRGWTPELERRAAVDFAYRGSERTVTFEWNQTDQAWHCAETGARVQPSPPVSTPPNRPGRAPAPKSGARPSRAPKKAPAP